MACSRLFPPEFSHSALVPGGNRMHTNRALGSLLRNAVPATGCGSPSLASLPFGETRKSMKAHELAAAPRGLLLKNRDYAHRQVDDRLTSTFSPVHERFYE